MRARTILLAALVAALGAASLPSPAQQVAGVVFRDDDGDGIRDPGEPALAGVTVRLRGQRDAGGTFDETVTTGEDGAFSFSPGDGCYLLHVEDPPGWRRTLARADGRTPGSPGYVHPVGLRRFGGVRYLVANLEGGHVRYTSMGDSIAWNWNNCLDTSSFWYSKQVRDRLRCAFPSATVDLDEAAVKGQHTDDLLVDDHDDMNNVFRVIEAQSDLVTISIIGNDLLNNEPSANPTQDEINTAAAEMIDSRANLQEILSALVSEIPGADIELNTLYDNLAWNCSSGDSEPFHVQWLPVMNRMLRDVAWGQVRRVTNAEVFAEFAHEDLADGCTGYEDQICHWLDDDIHPKDNGYHVIREKVWESLDGVNLGPKDGIGAGSITGADHGYLERVIRLFPTAWEARNGAEVTDPEKAFALDGEGASIRLGIGTEEVRFRGFPDWYDEIVPVRVIVGIRYRTTGTVTDDFYRVEASRNGVFRAPPGHAFTPTDWDFYTPIVGSGGPNMPPEDPDYPEMKLLVVPNVPEWRDVSATLTKNPVVAEDGTHYEWPPLTREEIGTTEVRVVAAPVANTPGDDFRVVVDAVWLDVYGRRKERPPEVTNVTVEKEDGGGLAVTFDELAGADRYDVYFGSLAVLHEEGRYTHGHEPEGKPLCDVATEPAGEGRRRTTIPADDVPGGDRYLLVTGHVDGVESPAGFDSAGAERPRSECTCP